MRGPVVYRLWEAGSMGGKCLKTEEKARVLRVKRVWGPRTQVKPLENTNTF